MPIFAARKRLRHYNSPSKAMDISADLTESEEARVLSSREAFSEDSSIIANDAGKQLQLDDEKLVEDQSPFECLWLKKRKRKSIATKMKPNFVNKSQKVI